MKLQPAIDHYGSQRDLAAALDLHEAQVSRWKKDGGVVPIKHALKLVDMTRGELPLNLRDY